MKRVTVTELKRRLSQYLRLVKRGETVEVLEHDVPVARLQGIHRGGDGKDPLLDRLICEGLVTQAKRKPTKAWLKNTPAECKGDAVRILIEQRGNR